MVKSSDLLRLVADFLDSVGIDDLMVLLDPDYRVKVKDFCRELAVSSLNELVVGGCTYEILSFLKDGETSVDGVELMARTDEMGANTECHVILMHQDQIPAILRGRVVFVFPNSTFKFGEQEGVFSISWGGTSWVRNWNKTSSKWDGFSRVLRPKQ